MTTHHKQPVGKSLLGKLKPNIVLNGFHQHKIHEQITINIESESGMELNVC